MHATPLTAANGSQPSVPTAKMGSPGARHLGVHCNAHHPRAAELRELAVLVLLAHSPGDQVALNPLRQAEDTNCMGTTEAGCPGAAGPWNRESQAALQRIDRTQQQIRR